MDRQKVFTNIIKLAIKFPSAIIKQLNLVNLRTLRRAILNEPPEQIISNIKQLLIKTEDDSFKKATKKINQFGEKLSAISSDKICILISHEATRTGAPLIILKYGQELLEKHNCQPVFLLCKGGKLQREFEEYGLTYNLQFPHNQYLLRKEINDLLQFFSNKAIHAVYFNSEGSTFLLEHFNKHNVGPRISLIHEMGSYYPKNAWKHINKYSHKIVFPARIIKQLACENTSFMLSKTVVLGQGLLKEGLLTINREQARAKLCQTLGIPENSFIVLTCGTPIARKGIDIFILTAISYFTNYQDFDTYFLWLGDGPNNEHQIWAERDIKLSGFDRNIIIHPGVKDISKWFGGSNIFYLTSRGDPYPCVVHEALASGLPVICFKNAGGSEEIINENCGAVLSFGDIRSVNHELHELKSNKLILNNKSNYSKNYAKSHLNFSEYALNLFNLTN